MKSDLPKPLHRVCGRSLLGWVVHALDGVELDSTVVVVGHGRELVVASLEADFERPFLFAEQLSQRGTGDAAMVGLSELDLFDNSFSETDHVLVVPGDTPLLTSATVASLVATHIDSSAAATLMTSVLPDPTGYGRIIRNASGGVDSIIEQRDASEEQRAITEINAGMYCFKRSLLAPALRMISTNNAQGEMYLTDAIGVLAEAGHPIAAQVADPIEISGVNDRAQLGFAATHLGERIAEGHMRNGVTLEQPLSTVIEASVLIEPDATIRASTVLEGTTTIGSGAIVGPNSHLRNATIESSAQVIASVIDGVAVSAGQVVGPHDSLSGDASSD